MVKVHQIKSGQEIWVGGIMYHYYGEDVDSKGNEVALFRDTWRKGMHKMEIKKFEKMAAILR